VQRFRLRVEHRRFARPQRAAPAIGIVGCDTLSDVVDYSDRRVSILFGDAAGAAVVVRDDDPALGCRFQNMGSVPELWHSLYMPRRAEDILPEDHDNPIRLGYLRMNGQEVFRFAVSRFRAVIEEALTQTGLSVDDISQFICHQSNTRIIESAMNKLGLPADKVLINIDRYGNTSAGSCGLVLDELYQQGKINRGDHVIFAAFGGGLTWASSVWKL
jgi:3-oxoacyl-[acyl-carrier-protein] synthase-3